jgi:CRISPR type III-A-associated protein Csm2
MQFDLKNLRAEVLSEHAQTFAERLCENDRKNKYTQVRKFYTQLVELYLIVFNISDEVGRQKKFNEINLKIHLLVPHASYAKARDLVSDDFLNFIKNLVRQIDSPETLEHAKYVFEAVLGFYKNIKG